MFFRDDRVFENELNILNTRKIGSNDLSRVNNSLFIGFESLLQSSDPLYISHNPPSRLEN